MSVPTSVAISSDFSSAPLSKLTIADTSDEEDARDGWGGLGLLIIAAWVLGGIALSVWGQRQGAAANS
jgi:hypothetical protein